MNQIMEVVMYTDGACIGNPGPGGYAAVLIYGERRKELSGGYRQTTNNRMEIMAVIAGLKALKMGVAVKVYTDSQYVANAINQGWARRWRENGWVRNKDKERAKNVDLWEELLLLCEERKVIFEWIKGHNNENENEYCDRLAVACAKLPGLPHDEGFETLGL